METTHVFVRAPSDSVRKAWREFADKSLKDDTDGQVAVIPADGGCFVVATPHAASRAGLLARRLRRAGRPRVSRRDLEHFRRRVEHSI